MKKGRILVALCAVIMSCFVVGVCVGCDGKEQSKIDVNLMTDVIAEKCAYSYFAYAGGLGMEGKINTSELVTGRAEKKVYYAFSFTTKSGDEFELDKVTFKVFTEYNHQLKISLMVKDIGDNSKNLYDETKDVECSTLTETERQQGKEISWSLNKLKVKGSTSKSSIIIWFYFYKDGELVGPSMTRPGPFGEYDTELFSTMNTSIGGLLMK